MIVICLHSCNIICSRSMISLRRKWFFLGKSCKVGSEKVGKREEEICYLFGSCIVLEKDKVGREGFLWEWRVWHMNINISETTTTFLWETYFEEAAAFKVWIFICLVPYIIHIHVAFTTSILSHTTIIYILFSQCSHVSSSNPLSYDDIVGFLAK